MKSFSATCGVAASRPRTKRGWRNWRTAWSPSNQHRERPVLRASAITAQATLGTLTAYRHLPLVGVPPLPSLPPLGDKKRGARDSYGHEHQQPGGERGIGPRREERHRQR